jgi:hypothetical protein
MAGIDAEVAEFVATLRECTTEFRLDKFYADMAKPVVRAIAALERADRPLAACELRAAVKSLPPANNSGAAGARSRPSHWAAAHCPLTVLLWLYV